MFLQCEGCGQAVIAVIKNNPQYVNAWMGGQQSSPGDIVATYPKMEKPECPAHTPDPVRKAYLSGLDNLNRPGNSNAAAMMFRRTVEVAVKGLLKEFKQGDKLAKLIERLRPMILRHQQ
jgi:hypothetical protein